MSDDDFLADFEACTLPEAEFDHRGHVRLAFILLRRRGFEQGIAGLRAGIRAYATSLGAPDKYHETITVAFAALVHEALELDAGRGEDTSSFEGFVGRHPHLLDKHILLRHYTPEVLASDHAKRCFVLPRHG